MKASELIQKLQGAIEAHGDLNVFAEAGSYKWEITEIYEAYGFLWIDTHA